ncbi:hypothetical protein NECAME_17348, partial [Necator americanus]
MALPQLSTSERRKRLMKRIHTFQSEEQSAHGSSFDVDFPSVHFDSDVSETSSPNIDRTLLFVPDAHELKLDKGEKPPHKRDVIEKIPMRVRSQSWLIRTRHLLHEERVERVEIKDIRLPHQLTRSMAAEAEAVRRARAAIIHAEGEKNAS